jgi:hypothetical protein
MTTRSQSPLGLGRKNLNPRSRSIGHRLRFLSQFWLCCYKYTQRWWTILSLPLKTTKYLRKLQKERRNAARDQEDSAPISGPTSGPTSDCSLSPKPIIAKATPPAKSQDPQHQPYQESWVPFDRENEDEEQTHGSLVSDVELVRAADDSLLSGDQVSLLKWNETKVAR